MNDRVIGDVRFRVESNLLPWDSDPSDCIITIKGRIYAFDEARDKSVEAGRMKCLLVRGHEAERQGFDVAMVCDSHDQELHEAFAAVFNVDAEPRPSLGIKPLTRDLLYLSRLRLKPGYRRRGLAAQAIRMAIVTFVPGGVLIADRELDIPAADREALGIKLSSEIDYVFIDDGASGKEPNDQVE